MAHDVFISYSAQDKSIADAACATLETRKVRCWIAPRDVLPGVPYGEALSEALQASRVLVLVFSSNSNKSQHVMREVESAASSAIPIVPLRVEDVELSKSLNYFLKSIHWLDALTPPLERHLRKLADTVQTLLERAGRPAADPAASPRIAASELRRSPFRRNAVVGLIAAVLLIGLAIGGLAWALPRDGRPEKGQTPDFVEKPAEPQPPPQVQPQPKPPEPKDPIDENLKEVPIAVRQAAKQAGPEILWLLFVDYDIPEDSYKLLGKNVREQWVELFVRGDGQGAQLRVEIPLGDVPQVVRDGLKSEAPDFKPRTAQEVGPSAGKTLLYRFEGETGDAQKGYAVGLDGKMAKASDVENRRVSFGDLPSAVHRAAEKATADTTWTAAYWTVPALGKREYYKLIGRDGQRRRVEFLMAVADAAFRDLFIDIPTTGLPAAASDALKAKMPGFEPQRVQSVGKDDKKVQYYAIDLETPAGKKARVIVSPDGKELIDISPKSPPQLKFQKLESAAGRFTVEVPGAAKEKTEGLGDTGLTQHSFDVVVPPSSRFHISFIDFREASIKGKDPQAVLKAYREGIRDGAEFEGDKVIHLGKAKVPGREYRLESEKDVFVRERLVLAGNRLYIVMLASRADKQFLSSTDADRFFDSFAIAE